MFRILKTCIKCACCAIPYLISFTGLSQKSEVLYAQFYEPMDTTLHQPRPPYPNPDTVAKWIFIYVDGKSIVKQTEDSPYEKKTYRVNKSTGRFDSFIDYNMSKNDINYNDYTTNNMREVVYFFDVKYLIEDKLPEYEWKLQEGEKTILNFRCKLASARYPVDKTLLFDVWYTEEFPAQGGPMDLNGLPGLILEVDRNKQPFYKALSVKKLPDDANIVIEKPSRDEKGITLSEYNKIRFGVPFINHDKRPPFKDSLKNK